MRNEDLLVLPSSWLPGLYPRRGGVAVPAPFPTKDAVKKLERLVAAKAGNLTGSLAHPETDPDLRAAAQGVASPLGAAVVAAKVLRHVAGTRVDTTVIADAWIAAHGLVFAAVAAAELVGLRVGEPGARWLRPNEPIVRRLPAEDTNLEWLPILGRVRAHLVAANDEDHAAVRDVLATVRTAHGLPARAVTSFLMPECKDWVDEDIATCTARTAGHSVGLVMFALGDAEQLSRFTVSPWRTQLLASDGALATVMDGVGTALAPVLGELLGSLLPYHTEERERIATALAALPDDDAFRTLIAHAEQPQVRLALLDAGQRFPVRAIRLLDDELFEAYATGYPEALELARPHLGTDWAPARVPECDPGEIPAPLLVHSPLPELPGWADAAILPRVRLSTGRALPIDTTRRLVVLLLGSRAGKPPAGLDEVVAACDRASLAAFGWALFQRWQSIGMPTSGTWAMLGLAWIGDDDVVRRLTPLIKVWPGSGGHHRSVAGLSVLTGLGTDVALIHLNDVAEKVKFAGLASSARSMLHAVAGRLGLTGEQLADRLVPDLGLRADGGLVLDYGPRRFVVGFDDQLRPTVADEDGKRLKSLPKPGARDDATLGPAAYQRFSALKKDVRTLAGDQIRRFERAMVTGRRWTAPEFATFIVGHPLVSHLARRLVWSFGAAADGSTVDGSFRVAEDGSYAGVDDDTLPLPGGALVGVAHPLRLAAATRWADVFADYELLQPFPQLGRETYALTPQEAKATQLDTFDGRVVPSGRVLGLERSGWSRATPQDNGHQPWIERPLPDGLRAYVRLKPGFTIGRPGDDPEQTLSALVVSRGRIGYRRNAADEVQLGAVDEVALSELLRDLHQL
ncbi:DUF4132 domain-containing protein [Dactylosporangium siamense]|uniref:DUF4132 domain-containing protein n=1 Tax=Dactylosporangium siamense TaxID=685454 RepID=A0A919PWJ2_9ACTN|nr:DUF4132 domain-containing protein [Dactylosporangium siamense]GIG51449.1 hypothetical protein Dsi01nite_094900 [Dactylosporangium siamense]